MVCSAINEEFYSNRIIVDETLNVDRYVKNVLTPGLQLGLKISTLE